MTVHIDSGEGDVRIVRHVGLLQVQVAQPERQVVGALHGIGLASTPLGLSAGFTRQRWTAIGPQCRAVLWVDGPEAVDAAMRQTLAQIAGVCLVDERSAPVLIQGANNPTR
ncbi:hypothetical protein HLB44_22005 [Aquincola sp. S2]|uniref:Uncharacterized protein n=1 Tax=Pseudaquabacterium terrae TaxID=2732868 RepID=A0ABX2EM60_9BURK|nr:hypothetical protein [Aquabacterium terrae]NRF69683.1 hypothetical protein [Aquabacterium terrae]